MENNALKINICQMHSDDYLRGCGYCKDPITNIRKITSSKFGLTLEYIPIDIYEQMFFKGWTRCGDYFYKSCYEKTCCKLYQPRININEFKISNEQKKIMKRFRKYLSGEYEENKLKNKDNNYKKKEQIEDIFQIKIFKKVQDYINSKLYIEILKKYITKGNENYIQIFINKIKETKVRRITNKKYNSDYSCDLIFIIKNIFNSIANKEKNNNKNILILNNDLQKIINDLYNNFINFYKPIDENISLCEETGHINFKIKNQEEFNKYIIQISKKQEKPILKDKNKKEIKKEQKEKYILDYFPELISEPEIYLPLKHNYTCELTDNISVQSDEERFKLYQKYQFAIHREIINDISHYNLNWGKSILQKDKMIPLPNDLKNKTKHPEIYPNHYGSFNFIHRIDGKIVAVTVWDILPFSLESVYCYYDPDYSFLDLGVFTVIREIEYMKSFQKLIDNNFIYYTMGEFSQTCKKLKYKGNYFPTQIMDHYTGKYVYLTEEIKKLIEDGKCHHLVKNVENSELELFSENERENIFWNLIIEIKSLGDYQYLDEFCNLYLNDDQKKMIIFSNIRRFLEIIDKKSFEYCKFYFEDKKQIYIK